MSRPISVLVVTVPLPSASDANTMAPLARQIASLRDEGVDVQVFEVEGAGKVRYFTSIPKLHRAIRAVDIVHGHFGYCGWLARFQWSKPIVVSFMGDDLLGTPGEDGQLGRMSVFMTRVNRYLARLVDAVIVKSAEMARVVAPVEASVVPNGVDLSVFEPMERTTAIERLDWDPEKRYVLFAGDPRNPRKQFSLASAATARASELMGEDLTLVPLSQVPAEQVPFYMSACEAMLMTSYVEGSPNVVKEAMACNLKVVSVEVGDVAELLEGLAGYRVLPRDADALAVGLQEVLGEPDTEDGRRGVIAQGLDLATVGRRVAGIYEQVLGRDRDHDGGRVAP
jgi:glycosyltransferase involved in cell wall biosynthesis